MANMRAMLVVITAGLVVAAASAEILAPAATPPKAATTEQPIPCTADEVRTLTERFIAALNSGDFQALDDTFADEPDFDWYTTDAPGARLDGRDRASLIKYFRDRHTRGEELTLRSLRFNGNSTGRRVYGNFEYTLIRRADDLPPTEYHGKGAALCYREGPDAIFVWSMAKAAAKSADEDSSCVSARVHYTQPPTRLGIRLPWVSAGRPGRRIVGYLWYYTPELRSGNRLKIYTGGRLPGGGATKIMWVPGLVGSNLLTINGRRLDGPGRFHQQGRPASSVDGLVFPSIVNVPSAGCWVVTVRNGRLAGRLAVVAIDVPGAR